MKRFQAQLAAHLASGATTLAWCWKLVRSDGAALGFTDHDRTIAFDGTAYEPATGLDASEAVAHAGFAVGGLEVTGALSSERITGADLEAGLYDDARIETWLVNWADPAQRHLMRIGSIGEVRREDGAFTAEVRGLAHRLDQPQGRLFRFTCDADLGDARCGVSLAGPAFSAVATVSETDGHSWVRSAALAGRADGLFSGGLLTFTSGGNAGRRIEIDRHVSETGGGLLGLWLATVEPIAAGDGFTVTAGCDKRLATCRDRFANVANFRGFPHMPGNDFVLASATRG
ncbi:baseplate hub protein [Propylenella binzhouense]|uniref:DUF2163 domain-containing protein n=1 Tax=Propylenella binzhouense TaxID=2555902 RepID=A0A964T9M7_9HYPH|nr:DUF2163 domain-containing protein [Propylenella binzhouense]